MAQDDTNTTPGAAGVEPLAPTGADGADGLTGGTSGDTEDAGLVLARVHEPYGSFDPRVEGLPVVTSEGVLVTKDQASQIKSIAKSAGVTISARKE